MVKVVGGRGNKAAYETVTVRVPIALKEDVLKLADKYREGYASTTSGDNKELVDPALLHELYQADFVDETKVCNTCYLEDKAQWELDQQGYEPDRLQRALDIGNTVNLAIWQIDNSFPGINLDSMSEGSSWKAIQLLVRYSLLKVPEGVKPATAKAAIAWYHSQCAPMAEMESAIADAIIDGHLDVFAALYEPQPVYRKEYWSMYYSTHFGAFQQNYWEWIGNPEVRDVCPELNVLLDNFPKPCYQVYQVLAHLADKVNPFYKEKPKCVDLGGGMRGASLNAYFNSGKLSDKLEFLETFISWYEEGSAALGAFSLDEHDSDINSEAVDNIMLVCFGCTKERLNELYDYHIFGQPEPDEPCWQVLGVKKKNATKADIKAAYRNLAKSLHPDVNPSQEAREQFQALEEAYRECLATLLTAKR